MKIAFLCSSSEPHKDGVGDYTRLLANECIGHGHECCIVALHDRHVTETLTEQGRFDILRLQSTSTWQDRIRSAKQFLDCFRPDWISLQFVAYGFQDYGIVLWLGSYLKSLRIGRRFHIMLHETWIGELANAKLKHKIIGQVQRKSIITMIRQLAPDVVHTSNNVYRAFLERDGIQSRILPLFGNIPVSVQEKPLWIDDEMRSAGIDISESKRERYLLAGFFGTIQPDWLFEPFLTAFRETVRSSNRQLIMLSIGSTGIGQDLWDEMARQYSPEIIFHQFGRRSANEISQYLMFLDFGIATTDRARVSKSGTVAAMLDHGLPVIVSQVSESFPSLSVRSEQEDPLLYSLSQFKKEFSTGITRGPARPRLPDITILFLNDIGEPERASS